MMATERVRALCHQMNNELQIIMGGTELGDLDSSLRSVGRAYNVLHALRLEIEAQKRTGRVVIWPKGETKVC